MRERERAGLGAAPVAGLLALLVTALVAAQAPVGPVQEPAVAEALLRQLNDYPHAVQIDFSEQAVLDHEIGLGAMQKVRGAWQFKHSERQSGLLTRYTWQIVDGFTSLEVLGELEQRVQSLPESALLFSCDGRACGHGSQWANRVFGQRVLYGRAELQRYRVYSLSDGAEYRLVLYGSARTTDRQYLQAELLQIDR